MFGMSMWELLVILLVALIFVGPKKLPDLAKGLGKGLQEFRKATSEIKTSLTENETYKDIQEVRKDFRDTVDAVSPNNLLRPDAPPVAAEPAQAADVADRAEASATAQADAAESAPLDGGKLQPREPRLNLEGRQAVMDALKAEADQEAPAAAPAAPAGDAKPDA